MKNISITESRNPDTINIDLMDSLQIAQAINNEDKKIADAIAKVLPQIAQAIDAVTDALQKGGRLAYFGAGTSGRIGILDASEMPPTFGVSPNTVQAFIAGGQGAVLHSVENAEDSAEFAQADMTAFAPTNKDVVVAVSASGNPQYVVSVLQEARKAGAVTVAVTSNPNAKTAQYADIAIIPVVGEEAVTGSSRMKSGTAQKMVLNMISTGAMIRIGKTYQNYMIDVQTTNKKLVERGCRFISEICSVDDNTAQQYLEAAGGNVKTACVMLAKKCTKEKAQQLLAQHNGILRKVL